MKSNYENMTLLSIDRVIRRNIDIENKEAHQKVPMTYCPQMLRKKINRT